MSRRRGSFWAITSFFNPAGFHRRTANHRAFRAALPIPLATVELGFDGAFHLSPADADLYVRLGDGDVLWQKERLLNALLRRLPAECRHVAWLDADVMLARPDWPRAAVEALETVPLVQLFDTVRYLERDDASVGGATGGAEEAGHTVPSVVSKVQAGASASAVLTGVVDRTAGAASGMAWAARRELLDRHGFPDTCVIGGGDTALACAAYGVPEVAVRVHHMNAAQEARYRAWAGPFGDDVGGRVGLVRGELHHLWHGELARRDAGGRHVALAAAGFDPDADLALGAEGAWRWASAKPALHALLRDYFVQRGDNKA